MRIFQLIPTLGYGDAMGNDVLALRALIKKLGYTTGVFYEHVQSGVLKKTRAQHYKNMPRVKEDDIVIYHLSTASPMSYFFSRLECRKIIVYHNITPPEFFLGYSGAFYRVCEDALVEAEYLADKVDYCLADSEFNKSDLERMGYACPIDVLPILIPFEDYAKPPDAKTIKTFLDGKKNMLFVGRVAPNKKIESVIKTFYQYQRHVSKNSRLFLVGSHSDGDAYYRQLRAYVDDLRLTDVVFAGHVSFGEVIAYYKLADVFLCMSEHEGFCVPLVEAMYFDKPIVAYDSPCAVRETLGGSGVLLEDNDPLVAALVVGRILEDKALSEAVIAGQRERLKYFRHERIARVFDACIKSFVGKRRDKNSDG